MRKAVVTGAGGFIGRATTARLLRDGWGVTALDLPGRHGAVPPGAERMEADIRDRDALRAAFREADVVFHTAALFDLLAPWAALQEVNVEGVRRVCAAARGAGVGRVICWGSSSVYGVADDPVSFREDRPIDLGPLNAYARSKHLGELAALGAAEEGGVEVVVVRPADVYGPGAVQGLGQALWAFKVGLMGAVPGPGTSVHSHVHVDDVAGAAVHLAQHGRNGAIYNIADRRPMAVADLYALARRTLGAISLRDGRISLPARPRYRGRPIFHVPAVVLRAFAKAEVARTRHGWLSGKLGPRPLATPEGVDLLLGHHIVDPERLLETGYQPEWPDVREGVVALVESYRATGWAAFHEEPPHVEARSAGSGRTVAAEAA